MLDHLASHFRILPHIVARSILEALLVFQDMRGVHTGILQHPAPFLSSLIVYFHVLIC